jgi:hypothetical protein
VHAIEMAYLYLAMCLQWYSLLNVRGLHRTSNVVNGSECLSNESMHFMTWETIDLCNSNCIIFILRHAMFLSWKANSLSEAGTHTQALIHLLTCMHTHTLTHVATHPCPLTHVHTHTHLSLVQRMHTNTLGVPGACARCQLSFSTHTRLN